MPPLNIVGPQIKKARLQKSPPLTQQELAIRLQLMDWRIDRFGVSKIERGERQVTDREVVLLATALGVSPGSLLQGEQDGD